MSDIIKQQVRDILGGKTKAPNPFIEFLVKRATESRDEGNQLVTKIKEAEGMLGVMRRRSQELKGATASYVEDIETWLAKGDNGDDQTDTGEEPGKSNGSSETFTDEERKALMDDRNAIRYSRSRPPTA